MPPNMLINILYNDHMGSADNADSVDNDGDMDNADNVDNDDDMGSDGETDNNLHSLDMFRIVVSPFFIPPSDLKTYFLGRCCAAFLKRHI